MANFVLTQPDQVAAHTVSVLTIVAAFFKYIPAVAALIPAVYYVILIWESKTIQRWMRARRMKSRARRLVLLKAEAIKAQAKVVATHVEATAAVTAEAVVAEAATAKVVSEAAAVDASKPPS